MRLLRFKDERGAPILINMDAILCAAPINVFVDNSVLTKAPMTSVILAPGIGRTVDMPFDKFAEVA